MRKLSVAPAGSRRGLPLLPIALLVLASCGGSDDPRRPDVAGYGERSPAYYLAYAADPASDPERAQFDAVTYSDSPKSQSASSIVESCAAARTYPVYALGTAFASLRLSDVTTTCQAPKRTGINGRVIAGSMSATRLSYGPCVEGGQGCSPTLYISNRPARAEPHSRLHSGREVVPHEDVRIGGRRAAIMDAGEDGVTIEIYEPATTVTIQGAGALARHAAQSLRSIAGSPRRR